MCSNFKVTLSFRAENIGLTFLDVSGRVVDGEV